MKRILITGSNSFIGTSVEKYLSQWPDKYKVDTINMENEDWKEKDFSVYDSVFHVAGIVHSDTGRLTPAKVALYERINTRLALNTAYKAKNDGVKQFIFMSSSLVYGEKSKIGKKRVITSETKPNPDNCYGESKLKAEKGLIKIEQEIEGRQRFKVAILRPPMVYGANCKGNYPLLSKIAKKTRFFPKVANCRSVIYIENLAELIRLLIDNDEKGVFFPQNKEYVNTSELIMIIRKCYGKKTSLLKGFTWALKLLSLFTGKVNKAFGSNYYEQSISEYKQEYRLVGLEESIRRTEL